MWYSMICRGLIWAERLFIGFRNSEMRGQYCKFLPRSLGCLNCMMDVCACENQIMCAGTWYDYRKAAIQFICRELFVASKSWLCNGLQDHYMTGRWRSGLIYAAQNWIGEADSQGGRCSVFWFKVRSSAVQWRINIVNSFPGICRAWHKYCTKLNIVGMDAFLKMAIAIASILYCKAHSGWVFATVERIIRWNHSAGTQSLAAAPEGWRPRNNP